MGIGSAKGKDKAQTAASMAISSPLLETSIQGAKGILLSVLASPDVGLEDIDTAATMISNECNTDASVIFGVAFDQSLEDEMRITIIAAGFDADPKSKLQTEAQTQAESMTAKYALADIFG